MRELPSGPTQDQQHGDQRGVTAAHCALGSCKVSRELALEEEHEAVIWFEYSPAQGRGKHRPLDAPDFGWLGPGGEVAYETGEWRLCHGPNTAKRDGYSQSSN